MYNPQTITGILAGSRRNKIVTANEEVEIRRLDAEYKRLEGLREKLSVQAAINFAKRDQVASLRQKTADGDKLDVQDLWEAPELKRENQRKRAIVKDEQRAVADKAAQLAKVIFGRLKEAGEAVISTLQERERETAVKFGATYLDTTTIAVIRDLINHIDGRIPAPGTAASVRTIFAGIISFE
jgi:hypothetical protein